MAERQGPCNSVIILQHGIHRLEADRELLEEFLQHLDGEDASLESVVRRLMEDDAMLATALEQVQRISEAQQDTILAACSAALRNDWELEISVSHGGDRAVAVKMGVEVQIT